MRISLFAKDLFNTLFLMSLISSSLTSTEHVETCVMPQSYRSIQSYRSLGREVKWKMYLEDEATEGPDILEWILTKNKQWKKSSDEVPKCLSAVHKLISDRFDVRAHDTDATEIDESL